MKKYAVIVAAGTGSRMGGRIPKQFLKLKRKPVVLYTINTFLEAYTDLTIILVIAPEYSKTGENVLRSAKDSNRILLTNGGNSRFDSVKKGLDLIQDRSIVFVHDAVRCLVSIPLIHRCYETTLEKGNAIPVIQASDSIRIENEDGNETISREKVKIVQTPQTFHSDILKTAYEQPFEDLFTDEATVVERLGIKINLVEGEQTNIKITRPHDLLLAEQILEERKKQTEKF
jgi:2-C-methyl-D-erythritol 4-phosphate cytidylyltransferase